MNALRQVMATIQRYLGGLSSKDKILIGSLLSVAVMALLLSAAWSSRRTMVELLPGMGPEDQARAKATLEAADIAVQMTNGRVMVPAEQRLYSLAMLQQGGAMPEDTQTLFANLVSSQNWMASSKQSDQLATAALSQVLSAVIGNFRGVERATVMIDAPEVAGFGTAYRKPTASVGVVLKQGKSLDREMVEAIAAMIAGSKAGLAVSDVKVVDLRNGRQYSADKEEAFRAGDYLELVVKTEQRVQQKLIETIRVFDPLAVVAVSAQVDTAVRRTSSESFMPSGNGTVSVATKTRSDTSQQQNTTRDDAAEPGVASNVTADLNRGTSGSQQVNTKEQSEEDFQVKIGSKREEIVAPGGMPTRLAAMVSLSREYIANLVKMQKPATSGAAAAADAATAVVEVTQAEIEAAFVREKERLEKDLLPLIQASIMGADSSTIPRVTVSLVPVPQAGLLMAGGGGVQAAGVLGGGGGAGSGLVGQLLTGGTIKTVALGLLAVVALGMMLVMVKKSATQRELPTAEQIVGLPPIIEAGEDVVGEADEGSTAMEGIELGESQIRTKKKIGRAHV